MELDEATRKSLNKLAREQLKLKLLADLRMDIDICKLEGWDYTEYLDELKEMITEIDSGQMKWR